MSDRSKIEWTDATWNPVRGCTKVSPGCMHCYAEVFAERFRGVLYWSSDSKRPAPVSQVVTAAGLSPAATTDLCTAQVDRRTGGFCALSYRTDDDGGPGSHRSNKWTPRRRRRSRSRDRVRLPILRPCAASRVRSRFRSASRRARRPDTRAVSASRRWSRSSRSRPPCRNRLPRAIRGRPGISPCGRRRTAPTTRSRPERRLPGNRRGTPSVSVPPDLRHLQLASSAACSSGFRAGRQPENLRRMDSKTHRNFPFLYRRFTVVVQRF